MREYHIEYCFTEDHPIENNKLFFGGINKLLENLNNLKKISYTTNEEGNKELIIKNELSGDLFHFTVKGNPNKVGSILGDIILFICDMIISESKEEKTV